MFCVCERMSKSYVYTSVNLGKCLFRWTPFYAGADGSSQATTSPFTTASWPAQQRARVRYPNAPFPGWEARLGAADLSGDRSQGRDLVAIY